MYNNGQILLGGINSHLLIPGAVKLFGASGRITLLNSASIEAPLLGGPHHLTNPQLIGGVDTVSVPLNNPGTGVIRGNVAGSSLLVGGAITITGLIEAGGGGTLNSLSSAVTNTNGLIQALAGSTPRGNLLNPADHTFDLIGGLPGSRLSVDGPVILGGNYTVTPAGADNVIGRINTAADSIDRLTNTRLMQGSGLIEAALTDNEYRNSACFQCRTITARRDGRKCGRWRDRGAGNRR